MAIPLTVIGGFLGAGKTTLLNHVLHTAPDRRYAVMVNDFGKLNIDAELIAEHGGTTATLTNGCICCSMGDDVLRALFNVLQSPLQPEHILIEASGVAQPWRIAEIAFLDSSLALDGVIVLANAETVCSQAQDTYIGKTVIQQLQAADIIVLNKIDLAAPGSLPLVQHWLTEQQPGARIVRSQHGQVPLAVLFGLHQDHAPALNHAVPDHQSQFRSFSFQTQQPFKAAALRSTLEALPVSVIRAKGVLWMDHDPDHQQRLQLVGRRWQIDAGTAWPCTTQAGNRLVILGTPEMPTEDQLQALFNAALA